MKKKIFSIIFLIGILILNVYFARAGNPSSSASVYREGIDAVYYQVLDNYGLPGHERFPVIINDPGKIKQLRELYKMLFEEDRFRYMEIFNCLLQYKGFYDKENSFIYGYGTIPDDELHEFINQEIILNGEKVYITNIKGMFIGERSYREDFSFQNHILEGEGFSHSDFEYDGTCMSVILGSDYAGLYEVGDRLTVLYLSYPLQLKVIGFLDQTSVVTIGSHTTPLDSYIIVPSFEVENVEDIDKLFCSMHLSNKTHGIIRLQENDRKPAVLCEFEKQLTELGLDYVCIPID